MWKRWLLGFISCGILCLVALMATSPWWLSSHQVEHLVNRFLPQHYSIQLAGPWNIIPTALQLADLKINTSDCTIAEFRQINLNWWNFRRLDVENAIIDYDCVRRIPTDEKSQTEIDLTALLSVIPTSEVAIAHLQVKNTESLAQSHLSQLLHSDLALNAHYDGEKLALFLQGKIDSAAIFQHHSELMPQNEHFIWQGQTDYQPTKQQQYHVFSSFQLENNLSHLPKQGHIKLDWEHSDYPVPKGNLQLSWDGDNGQISAQDLLRNQPLLDVPFAITNNALEVTWGTLYWTFDGYQPIKAFLGLKVKKPDNTWLPLKTDLNMIFQTFGQFGKGEIVISGKDGEIGAGKNLDRLQFDLKTRGDLRYNTTVAQTNLEYKLRGTFDEPWIVFNKDSIFKMDNIQPDSKIHVRLPLDNVVIGRYGLEGRLQATLQGFTPQLEQLNLKLDGYAHEFIAGIKTVFDLRDERQHLRSAEMRAANRWDWDIQGSAIWKALKTKITAKGSGFWEADHIDLMKLMANSADVNTAEVKIAPISLDLKDRLRWDYEKEKFYGLLQAKTAWIEFPYGGRFEKPVFGIGVNGKSINHFDLAGDLKAGALGPLEIVGHYEKQALKGKITWKEQSAKVFQPLFPQKWEWIIHQGRIKGETAFLMDEKGMSLNGEFNVQQGGIQLPDGEIKGLTISFPLSYQDLTLQIKERRPIQFYANNIRIGSLDIQNARFNIQGNYPNTVSNPLILNNVSLGVFDGQLTVDKLAFPQKQAAVLNLKGIDLSKVLEMAEYNQIHMRGRINANLPFWLNHAACLICNGKITHAEKLNIKLNDEVIHGLKSGGLTESILVDVIKNMDLDSFTAHLNLAPTGEMNLAATIVGYNPDKKTHHPITLNYTHKENMFELWKMIDYGSQFEQNLEYRLYQQVEKP